MIRGPKYESVQLQNKQSWWPIVKAMEEPCLKTESKQQSWKENKQTEQIVDRKRRQKSLQ